MFSPASRMRVILMANARLWQQRVPSEENRRKPVNTCTPNPAHAQGTNLPTKLDTDSSLKSTPQKRRSRTEVDPTRDTIPNKCTVSMRENPQGESRTHIPIEVCSSHWHQTD